MIARAARVEQEANHDLRRLVELLNLTEEQQDRVFQTLAEHSPSWVPGMQIAPAAVAGANTAGKRSELSEPAPGDSGVSGVPGIYVAPPGAGEVTAPLKTPEPTSDDGSAAGTDPMDEIMALLNPEQRDTLLQEEMDRAAWWAEVLPQIIPPDEIPSIGAGTPAPANPPPAGETRTYEGSDVLE
jgi:hypothetical protein